MHRGVRAAWSSRGSSTAQLKAVHWSIANETALADAELEYDGPGRIIVRSTWTSRPPTVDARLAKAVRGARGLERPGQSACFMIWTTTPWTLPANLAIAVHPRLPSTRWSRWTGTTPIARVRARRDRGRRDGGRRGRRGRRHDESARTSSACAIAIRSSRPGPYFDKQPVRRDARVGSRGDLSDRRGRLRHARGRHRSRAHRTGARGTEDYHDRPEGRSLDGLLPGAARTAPTTSRSPSGYRGLERLVRQHSSSPSDLRASRGTYSHDHDLRAQLSARLAQRRRPSSSARPSSGSWRWTRPTKRDGRSRCANSRSRIRPTTSELHPGVGAQPLPRHARVAPGLVPEPPAIAWGLPIPAFFTPGRRNRS